MSLTGQSESYPIDRGQFSREPPPRALVITQPRPTAVICRPGLIATELTFKAPGRPNEYGFSAVPEKFLGVGKGSPFFNSGVSPSSTDSSTY